MYKVHGKRTLQQTKALQLTMYTKPTSRRTLFVVGLYVSTGIGKENFDGKWGKKSFPIGVDSPQYIDKSVTELKWTENRYGKQIWI